MEVYNELINDAENDIRRYFNGDTGVTRRSALLSFAFIKTARNLMLGKCVNENERNSDDFEEFKMMKRVYV